jgi:hypothetical protein
MSIFDKSFLKDITNKIKQINSWNEYDAYLKTDIQQILNAQLLSHIVDYDSGENKTCFLLYKYEDKYIFLHIFTGTCSNCIFLSYNEMIENALEKSYVSTNLEEIEHYYFNCLSKECDNYLSKNLYL